MRNVTRTILQLAAGIMALMALAVVTSGQKGRATVTALTTPEQPLFSEYKGVRLDMTADQVRAKLGNPTMKADDQDYYIFSDNESAQFAYNASKTVVTISIDYTGAGAPDYRNVVGPSIDQMQDGSLYKMVRYEAQGFWVSYMRGAGTKATVTITIQKMKAFR